MDLQSSWKWINDNPNTLPDNICTECHNCTPDYNSSVLRVHRALQLPLETNAQVNLQEQFPRLPFIDTLARRSILRYYAQIERIKRISGLYAAAFRDLEQLEVNMPFVGSAAFASNVVRWEMEDMVRLYAILVINMEIGIGGVRHRSDTSLVLAGFRDTLNKVIAGNAVVFVEIFAIVDFCISHFRRYGRPRSQEELEQFEECLKQFVQWWDNVQPGNRLFGGMFSDPPMKDIEVDRRQWIQQGILLSLEATTQDERRSASTDFILNNEQNYTLQEYMYDIIDWGPYDPLEIGLVLRGYRAAAKFSYDKNAEIDERFIVTYDRSGWISEASDRYPYTIDVVSQFDRLWYESGDQSFLAQQHQRMIADATGY